MRLLLLSFLIAACSGPASVPPANVIVDDELALARAKWADADMQNYELTISRSCECLPEDAGPFVVTVEGGETTSVLYDGRPSDRVPPTVGELFEMLETAQAEGAPRVEATYHEDWGYPLRVRIDPALQIADDELSYRISELIQR